MNTAPHDRFKYRNVLECAPLRTDAYSRTITAKDAVTPLMTSRNASDDDSIDQLLYGGSTADSSITFEWPLQFPIQFGEYIIESADLTPYYAAYAPGDPYNDWVPIPELLRADAQTYMFLLTATGVDFIEPADDVLFAAHQKVTGVTLLGAPNSTVYRFDGAVHPLACTVQDQFCLNETYCTPLTHWQLASETAQNATVPGIQQEFLNSWVNSYIELETSIDNTVQHLGGSALLARDSFMGGIQGPLAPNQWQLEVEHWQSITLARMQRLAVEVATGPSDLAASQFVVKPENDAGRSACRNQQKVRSTAHTSFSVLGLCITLTIGGMIILVETFAEPLLRLIQRYRRSCLYRRLEWISNGTLQLQRMAHEELGAGSWVGAADDLPTTFNDECLATLDVTDPNHPKLIYGLSGKDEEGLIEPYSKEQTQSLSNYLGDRNDRSKYGERTSSPTIFTAPSESFPDRFSAKPTDSTRNKPSARSAAQPDPTSPLNLNPAIVRTPSSRPVSNMSRISWQIFQTDWDIPYMNRT
ncbi:MAG: hypothetical protein Q9227_007042 [Pyrenula ochraceoflavens]